MRKLADKRSLDQGGRTPEHAMEPGAASNTPFGWKIGATAAVLLLVSVQACGRGSDEGRSSVAGPIEVTGEIPDDEPARPPQATPPPAPAPKPRPPRLIELGATGPWVRLVQERLLAATYDPGPVDGQFGSATQHAVIAFEKVNSLSLDGTIDRREMKLILEAPVPSPDPLSAGSYVEVDIGDQVLFEVRDGRVVQTLPVSTGNGAYYTSANGTAVASTPRGSFTIFSKIAGWHVGYLGAMYYPSYFSGGYAIHGSSSVPSYPASHGCVRIPLHSSVGFFERNPIGTPVHVHD